MVQQSREIAYFKPISRQLRARREKTSSSLSAILALHDPDRLAREAQDLASLTSGLRRRKRGVSRRSDAGKLVALGLQLGSSRD